MTLRMIIKTLVVMVRRGVGVRLLLQSAMMKMVIKTHPNKQQLTPGLTLTSQTRNHFILPRTVTQMMTKSKRFVSTFVPLRWGQSPTGLLHPPVLMNFRELSMVLTWMLQLYRWAIILFSVKFLFLLQQSWKLWSQISYSLIYGRPKGVLNLLWKMLLLKGVKL